MSARRKRWSESVEAYGIRVRVYERPDGAVLWGELPTRGPGSRQSLRTRDRREALDRARRIAEEIAKARMSGVDPSRMTLGRLFDLYFTHRAPHLSESWRQMAEARRRFFLEAWGPDRLVEDIGQDQVDRFARLRRSGEIGSAGKAKADRGVRDGTINGDLRWLSSVFNWAHRRKVEGRRLIQANPLDDVTDRKVEKNPRRPVASAERYERTLAVADDVDGTGVLRGVLAVVRYSGHRVGAVAALHVDHYLRTPSAIREQLAELGHDEGGADRFPHGAIHWTADTDKQGRGHLTPISAPLRAELERYLMRSGRVGAVPLFPAPKSPDEPVRTDVLRNWLRKAEMLAGLPKLRGGLWHPYRRLWATERKHLPDVDVAAAGGWGDTRALKLSYQHADPDTVLRVVEHGT